MKKQEVYQTVEIDEIPKGKTLESVQKSERDYYLRKTNKVPFSGGQTVAELRKAFLEQVAADSKAKEEKFAKQIADQNKRNRARFGDNPLLNQETTAVTFGVMAEVKPSDIPEMTPADIDTDVTTTEAQNALAEIEQKVPTESQIKETVKTESKKETKKP